jgi:hypothetical protein
MDRNRLRQILGRNLSRKKKGRPQVPMKSPRFDEEVGAKRRKKICEKGRLGSYIYNTHQNWKKIVCANPDTTSSEMTVFGSGFADSSGCGQGFESY